MSCGLHVQVGRIVANSHVAPVGAVAQLAPDERIEAIEKLVLAKAGAVVAVVSVFPYDFPNVLI
jgi:hypothetical protein